MQTMDADGAARPEPETRAADEGVHVYHEPTISYVPPESLQPGSRTGPLIEGAFKWALVVDRGPRAGMAYVLAPGETSVGRDPSNDIFLDDVTVSRHHGKFLVEGDELVVVDDGSTNGTYVNWERTERAALAPGDEVMIGKYHLVVARGDG